MKKRIVSLLLTVVMIVSLFPATALAAENGLTDSQPDTAQQSEPVETVNDDTELPDTSDSTANPDEADHPDSVDNSANTDAPDSSETIDVPDDVESNPNGIEALNVEDEPDETEKLMAVEDGDTWTITVEETGTLQDLVEATPGYTQEKVTGLVISTEPGAFLNYADFTFMREQLPNLMYLNIADADCINDYDPANPVEHEIPNSAMSKKVELQTLVLSEKVTSIARSAFSGCAGLRGDLVIPDSVTYLGTSAFGFSESPFASLDSLTLSKNMEVVEDSAFQFCKISGTVTLPASLRYMGSLVFQQAQLDGLAIEEGSRLEYIGQFCFATCPDMKGELNLPDTVTYIGNYAFSACKSLTGELHLPVNLETLGDSAFRDCVGLIGDIVIPGSLKTVGSSAFQNCKGLTSVTFEEGIESIGASSFNGCSGLTGDIVFPNSLTTIGNSAFRNCTDLDGVLSFGENLTEIGTSAFYADAGLTGLTLPENLESLGPYAFYKCANVANDNLVIPDTLTAIQVYTFFGCGKITSVTIPDSVTTIGDQAFYYSGLSGELNLPDSITAIGSYAFAATKLERVNFGSGIQTIGLSAFREIKQLQAISALPDGLTELGNSVFYGDTQLGGAVVLPESLEKLGTYCFTDTQISKFAYHGRKITNLGANEYLSTLLNLECLDLSDSAVEKFVWIAAVPKLTEVQLPSTLKELTLTNKRALETIDLTGCTNLTNVDMSANAIDFSGGKPAEWLQSYTGTKKITGQNIMLYAAPGAAERTMEVGAVFADDYTIKTYHGTDLSTNEKWTAFRSSYQQGVAAKDYWISPSRLGNSTPITRNPNAVKTDKAGTQTITYSTTYNAAYPSLYENLNYSCKLTVGEGAGPADPGEQTPTLTITEASGASVGTKTYMDYPFAMSAKLSTGSVAGGIRWKVYADNNGAAGETESDAVLRWNSETGMFETTGVGNAWLTATVTVNSKDITSAKTKLVVNRRTFSVNLATAKARNYGAADPADFGYATTLTSGGKTETMKGISFTRTSGEDVGKYQIFLYDPADLSLSAGYGDTGFWAEYKAAAIAKFAAENPNFTLSLTTPSDGAAGNFTINPLKLTGMNSFSVNSKTYDATTEATINADHMVNGILASDLASGRIQVAEEVQFVSPDVKYDVAGKVIAQDALVNVIITGDALHNYDLPNGYTSGVEKSSQIWTKESNRITLVAKKTGTINQLTLSCDIAPVSREYDGTAAAAFESAAALEKALRGLCPVDQANIASITATFADKTVGTNKSVVLTSDQINFANYKMPTLTASITPAPLSVTGLTAEDKVYDGTVNVAISGTPSIDLSGVALGDDVSIEQTAEVATGQFYDSNAGTNKTVIGITGLGLTGADAGNYYLYPAETVRANIYPAALTVTPTENQYKSLGALDPVFTYTLSSTVAGADKLTLRGELSRKPGEALGEYEFTLGTLAINKNYKLELAENAPKFEIRDTNAKLESITVSAGMLSPAFDPDVESYTVSLPLGTTNVPDVSGVAGTGATVQLTRADSLTGETVITVTAADEKTTKTYRVNFAVTAEVDVTGIAVDATASQADGMVIAAGTGGSGTYLFSLDGKSWQSGNAFADKAAGTYTLYIRDAADEKNTANTQVVIGTRASTVTPPKAPNDLVADPATVIPYSADYLDITLTASGVEGAAYHYYISSGEGSINGNTLRVTTPGSVTVCAQSIKDGAISTDSKSLTLQIKKAEKVSMITAVTDVASYGGNNGSIAVTASGGLGTYQYRIENGAWQDTTTFSKLTAGSYTVYVRDKKDKANVTSELVSVTQAKATPSVAVNYVLGKLDIGDTSAVKENLTLPTAMEYGGTMVQISWSTSDPAVVTADGTVTRPSNRDGNKTVILTATLTCDGIVKKQTFEVTVIAKSSSGGGGGGYTPDTLYLVLSGNHAVWGQNSMTGTTARIDAPFNYFLNVQVDGRIVSASNYTAKEGSTIITLKPEYLKTLSLGKHIMTVNFTNGKAIVGFTIADRTNPQTGVENPFSDVKESDYFFEPVMWAVYEEITSGTSATTFSPAKSCTRAQAVTFLWRAAGSPVVNYAMPFADIPADAYYTEAVRWAVSEGITTGTSATTFSPDDICTRGQIVTLLYRANGQDTMNIKDNPFGDVTEDSYYYDAVLWASENGITSGTSANTFSPNDNCTRAQIVTFLFGLFNK